MPKLAGLSSSINTSGRMARSDKLIEIDRKFRSLDHEFCLATASAAVASGENAGDARWVIRRGPTDEFG
jgi:hypothetical protein